MNLYEVLGIKKDATKDEIKRKYRKRASATHPDKGGNESEFKSVALAYRILSDEEKRKRYDAGENPESVNNPDNDRQTAIGLILNIYSQIIENPQFDLTKNDLVGAVLAALQHAEKEGHKNKKMLEEKVKRFKKAMKRTRVKKGPNIIAMTLETTVRELGNKISEVDKKIEVLAIAKKILDDYDYDFDKVENTMDGFRVGFMNYGG